MFPTPKLFIGGLEVTDMCVNCHTRIEQRIGDKTNCPNYTENLTLGCLLMGLTSNPAEAESAEEDQQPTNPRFFLDKNGDVRLLISRAEEVPTDGGI